MERKTVVVDFRPVEYGSIAQFAKKTLKIILLCLVVILINSPMIVSAQSPSPDIQASLSSITVKLYKDIRGQSFTDIFQATLQIQGLNQNATVVDYYIDTFFEENDKRPPIDSENFAIIITLKNSNNFSRTEIHISLDPKSNIKPGSYQSNLFVISSTGYTIKIPFNLIISSSNFWILFYILFGVFVNLFLFLVKDIEEYKESLQDNVNLSDERIILTYYAMKKAFDEGRLENSARIADEFTNLINDWNATIDRYGHIDKFKRLVKNSDRIIKISEESESFKKDKSEPIYEIVHDINNYTIELYNTLFRVEHEGRVDYPGDIVSEFKELIDYWNDAISKNEPYETFRNIGHTIEQIMDRLYILDFAEQNSEKYMFRVPPIIDNLFKIRKNPEERFVKTSIFKDRRLLENRFQKWIIRDFSSGNWQYIVMIVTLGIMVANSWQTYLGNVKAFGASGSVDTIAAILFGFGSQTILTQGTGIARKWAETRST